MKPVVLIGMPGAGKTYWGRRVADAYDLPFADLDEYICRREGLNIGALFQQRGEDGFREAEAAALRLLVNTGKAGIIAAGGGTPAFAGNMDFLKQYSTTVYLRADVATLLQHLANGDTSRPLLNGDGLQAKLETLLKKRSPFYEQADHIFDTGSFSLATFAQILAGCTDQPS